jgi:hypothetical protein
MLQPDLIGFVPKYLLIKNKKMKLLLLCCSFFILNSIFSQAVTSPFMGDHFQNALLAAQKGQYAQVGGFKVAGSALFMEQEFSGEVHIDNGGVFNNGTFGYNLYNHQVIMNNGKEQGEIKSIIKYFRFNTTTGQVLTFVNTDSLKSKKKGYFLEIATGNKVNLYRYSYCTLVENPNFFSADYRLFDSNTEYYITIQGGTPKKLKTDRKNILKELGNSEKIAKYIDDEHLDLGKELDIAKIFIYANSL